MIIPGLSGIHIHSGDSKGNNCVSIAIDEIKHNGVKSGILTYIRCITRSMKVLYNPDTYIPLMSVLPFVKKGEKKLSPKKQFKLDRKKQKKEFREGQKKQKAPSVMVSVKKHISKSAFMGSKLIAGVSVFAGAMAVHDYQTVGITALPTIYYGVGSLGGALISSAPYARSVSRTNKALSQADAKLVQMDQLVGENQQLVKSAIATFETHMANNQSVQPASIEQLKQKVEQHEAHIAQVREKLNISNPVQKDADVHVAPASSGSGNHNAD